jgi:hypothetical protein
VIINGRMLLVVVMLELKHVLNRMVRHAAQQLIVRMATGYKQVIV